MGRWVDRPGTVNRGTESGCGMGRRPARYHGHSCDSSTAYARGEQGRGRTVGLSEARKEV